MFLGVVLIFFSAVAPNLQLCRHFLAGHLSSLNLPKSRLFGCEKLLLCSFLYLEVLVSKLQVADHLTVPIK